MAETDGGTRNILDDITWYGDTPPRQQAARTVYNLSYDMIFKIYIIGIQGMFIFKYKNIQFRNDF